MKIRLHTSSDYLAIAELRWRLKTEGMSPLGSSQRREFINQYLRHLEQSDRVGHTAHWLIEDHDAASGVMTVRIVEKEPSPIGGRGCWGYLTNSFIMPAKRNQGWGAQLIEAVKSWATDEGLELLIVWPSEASYAFYRRAGFEGQSDPLELVLDSNSR